MKNEKSRFRLIDGLLIAMMVVPLVIAMVIQILTEPASEGITITGAKVFLTIPMPLMDMLITEAQVNSWLVMISIVGLCLFLTHGMKVQNGTKRQLITEWCVEKIDNLVESNMDPVYHKTYPAFVGSIMALSVFSSLMSLLGLFPPTSDVNVVAGWGVLVFILITKAKLTLGPLYYAKGFLEPIPVMLPMNLIGEIATPVSMTFRHFGNVLSGSVISALVAWALAGLSSALLGWLPGILGEVPFLQIGIPAVLSAYFDVFSGCIQAFIFAMMTMFNVSGGYPSEEIAARRAKAAVAR